MHVDQENTMPGQGQVAGRRQGKALSTFRGPGPGRQVLGMINPNVAVSRNNAINAGKGAKQGFSSAFPIYCDDENDNAQHAPAAKSMQRSKASSHLPGLPDKENQPWGGGHKASARAPKLSHPAPRRPAAQKAPSPDKWRSSDSDAEEDDVGALGLSSPAWDTRRDSPMALDTSVQDSVQWRVPPLAASHSGVSPLHPALPSLPAPPSALHRKVSDIVDDPDYQQTVYAYLRSSELAHVGKAGYMQKQPDITPNMRCILVDWLVEVSEEYKLNTETLYLAVNYIDRFLSMMSVQRAKLQLVGTAAMFIASKYEEIYPPDVSEFVYITDDTYTKKQVLRMEHLVLKILEFDVSVPTSHLFTHRIAQMAGCDERTTSLASYINELSLMSADFLQFAPSQVAAACVALARHTLGLEVWPATASQASGWGWQDLDSCVLRLHATHASAEGLVQQATREKFKSSKHHGVSSIAPARLARHL